MYTYSPCCLNLEAQGHHGDHVTMEIKKFCCILRRSSLILLSLNVLEKLVKSIFLF